MEVVIAGAARARAYTVIGNAPLQDARLSLKARGLLAFCLSLPDNWCYSVAGLVKAVGSDGRDAVRAALRELEAGGYLLRRGLRSVRGEFARAEYVLSETVRRRPTDKPLPDKPPTDKPLPDKPPTDKPMSDKPPMDKPLPEKPSAEESLPGDLPADETLRETQLRPAAPAETALWAAEEPLSENPPSGFPPQQSKYIKNKYHQPTTTAAAITADADAGAAAEPLLSARLRSLAAACGVSEGLVARAAGQFGAAEAARYLAHMAGRRDIRNGGGWLMRALREHWEIASPSAAAPPRPDCPECGGSGYTLRGYADPQSGALRLLRVRCSRCRGV